MTHHITADRLVESAIKAVTEELFRDFDNTLRALCDEDDDRKAVFRTLRYARICLHVLCGYISKEETPEDGRFCPHFTLTQSRFCSFQEKRYICIELFDEMQSAAVQCSYMVAKSLPTTFLISTLRCHSDRYIKVSYPT